MNKLIGFTIATLLMLSSAFTQTTWKLDPVHSSVTFSITHMVLTHVQGHFKEFEATMNQDAENPAKNTFNVSIKTASISTDNDKRDGHLRSADFFDAEKFPAISFISKSFDKIDGNKYAVKGDLTMHGVTKPITITANYTGKAKDPWGNTREGFEGTTTINRNDFGVKYNAALETGGMLLGENVDVTIEAQFVQQPKSAGGTN